jgi:Ca2+-binding RTX toxin-like protein
MLLNSWLSRLIPSRSSNPFRNMRHRRITRLRQVERLEDRTLLSAIYVDASADALRADGTAELPFTTIQDGLDAATSGDQVEVAAGDYSENIVMKTGVTVIGDGADTTTITGRPDKYGVVLFDTVDTAGLSGFTIETTDPGHSRSRAVVFAGNTADTAVLERNIITESRYGVFVNSPARPSIINNTFAGDGDRQGIYIGNKPTDPTIVNNIIIGYREAGIHVVGGRTAPMPTIEHNDLFRNRKNYLNYPDLTGIDGNVSVKPGFLDDHAEENPLRSDSPLIDIGHPLFGNDPDGTLRDLGALPFDQKTNQATTWTFEIDQAYDVPFELFNVTTAGTVDIEISWSGSTTDLHAQLTGRRRNDLPDPTAAYAETTGNSPLSFSYDVTDDDLLRGPGWRIVLDDLGDAAHDAVGTLTVTVPFTESTDEEFRAQKISLRSGDLWPSQELQDEFLVDHAAAPVTGQHGIVSFSETPDCLEVKDLQHAGIFRQSFLPGHHVFGWLAPQLDLDADEIDGLVNWITPLDPEDKVDPDLLLGNYARFAFVDEDGNADNYARNADGTLDVAVLFTNDFSGSTPTDILAAEGLAGTAMSDDLWVVAVTPTQMIDLATEDGVEWIGAAPAPQFDENSTTRTAVNVNTVQNATINTAAGTITYAGLTGNGIVAGVDDSGVDGNHPDINEVAAISASAAGTHGTHVAGILAGNGSQSATNGGTAFQWRGMAPNAGIIDSQDLITLSNLATAINTNSMDLANHSHAVSPDGSYDAQNQTVDQAIQGDATDGGASVPRRPQVYSAGNNGTTAAWINNQVGFFSLTKQMKNAVVVGNWDVPQNDLVNSSSMGPTHDGRIKPDVVAPGAWNITSTGTAGDGVCYVANNTNGYGPCGGTSMASPVVAGITALMLEGWQTTYLDPSGTNLDQAAPAPSTLRALVIQSTTDIVNNDVRNGTLAEIDGDSNSANNGGVADGTGRAAATVGPDYATGWGLVDAAVAVDIVLDARDEHGVPVPNRIVQDSLQHLEVVEIHFAVDTDMITAGDDVRVTLAWDDVAGALQTPLASAALVNDLDLVLIDPNGNTFYPWQLGHTIRDASGNVIASAAQTPGTTIFVDLPFRDEAAIANAFDNTSITLTSTPAASNDYIPANAMTGAGAWVATRGRDHINNVEVVDIGNINLVAGHWTLQVSGFDVQDGPQDFSVVGQPHPDLADLVAYSDDKVTIGSLGEDLELDFTVENVGDDVSESAVQYEIRLSTDFELGADVILHTSAIDAIGILSPGDTQSVSTTVQITSSDVVDLLGAGANFDDLIENDVFLIVRVDSNDAMIAHGDVLENNETNIAFLQMAREADVVLVMDRSGSMSADVTVSNGVHSKLQVLQDSAGLFLELLRRDAGDRVAEVAFNATAEVVFGDASDELVEYTTANQATATAAVDALSDGGATNMTDALIEAWDLLTADGDSDRQKVLVLFSDGVPTTSTGGLPTDPRDLSTDDGDPIDLDSFEDAGIRIYSVGFGTEGEGGLAGIDIDLLEDLANVGDEGFYHVTGSALDLDKFFVNAVAAAIDSEVIIDPVGTVAAGDTVEAANVPINSEDSVVTFVMTWHSQTAQDIDIAVRTPSGLVVDYTNQLQFADRVSLTEADTYQVLEIHLPLNVGGEEQHAGNWTVLVNNNGTSSVDYSVSAIAESTLRMDVDVDDPPGGADYFVPGDQIPFNVTLTGDDRVPLGYSDVSIIPVVPLVNLNALLAAGIISEAQLAAVPTESRGETLNDTQRMIMAYETAYGSIADLVMELDPIPLEIDESSPDGGTWTGTFDSTEIPGPYTFVIRADGCSDLCEPFSREITRTINIFEEIEPLMTSIDIEMPNDNTIVVTVTPTNSDGTIQVGHIDGNDLSVGFGDGLSGSGTFTSNRDGSFSTTLTLADGQTTADLEIWTDGTILSLAMLDVNARVSQIEGNSAKHFGEEQVLNVAVLGQANGVTGVILKPVGNPPWAARNNELTGNDGLWQLSQGALRIAATLENNGSVVTATMPADLPVGEYTVQVETTTGLGPINRNVTYRVIGHGGNDPERIQMVDQGLVKLDTGPVNSIADWRSTTEELVRDVLQLPIGDRLTESLRMDAAATVLQAINDSSISGIDRHLGSVLEMDRFKPLVRAVSLARLDARFVDQPAVTTDVGDMVDVTLGNGVSLTFGNVSAAGSSAVVILEGDPDVPYRLQSRTHAIYEITTTATFDSNDQILISLNYEETDFTSEGNIRLFHMEDGDWVDRTATLDTTNNTVTARTSSLSPFMMTETPDLSLSGSSVIEGDSGSTDLIFTASLSEISSIDIQANYQVVGGTATDGVDFTASAGTVTIPAGSLLGTFSFPVLGDTEMEGFETVNVILEDATGATIVDSTATGTILDDEHSITFDAGTGSLGLVLDAGGSSTIDAAAGLVTLEINGSLDPSFPVINPADVTTIVVTGSADADNIDLAAISAGNGFTGLTATTINGGSGDDTISGSEADDKINGSGGDDVITGGEGNDTINGGGGEDYLVGGPGDDIVRGQGSSLDSLSGGLGDDTIDGGAGYDYHFEAADVSFTVTDSSLSGLGNDTLIDIQQVHLSGGSSDNVFDGTAFSGRLFFNGSGGNDMLRGGPKADRMFGGSGRDTLLGYDGDDVLRGQGGNQDSLVGGPGNDKLNGGIGHDVLDGGLGDDRLTGETGNDTIQGGVGLDQIYEKFDGDVTLTDSRMTGDLGTDAISGIETAYLKGGRSGNTINAEAFTGQTTLIGGGGVDRLIGGTNDDLLVGRAGDDLLFGGDGDDWLQGLRGDDLLVGGNGNDLLDGGTESDSLTGQGGNDLLYGRGGNDSVVGGTGRDTLWGGDGNDVMVGDDGRNSTTDSTDDDSIDGGGGGDTVRGGGGADSIADSIQEIDESFELIADWIDS